jgi:two-component system CheB/CheR fusion protein
MVEKDGLRHVVGIGASAGGLDPLVRFFDTLPRDTGMAFVIVQHLSPDFKSLMDELLARHTSLPIHLVEHGMPVQPNHVYLIPPKKEMIISGGRLLLSERDRQQELALPIDVFFKSLAQDCGPHAVAIVLSGGGSDGSRGILDVHNIGGLVLVQELATAQFESMPRAAIDSGVADRILPPEDMPRVLVEHASGRSVASGAEPAPSPEPQKGLQAVYHMLQAEFGIDFTHYKPSTVTRRIERRLALARSQDIEEYIERLRSEREELDALYHDLLIGVTRFFRDRQAFELLERRVLPELMSREPRDKPLRLWVAGCATGEEAYSLAILVHELLPRYGERPVKIFASDVHRGSLERATLGVYEEDALADVTPERLARYFSRTRNTWQVVPEIRQHIVFAQHNVIRDAPFTRLDLVTCRNLLIYLQPAAQQRVLSFFHFALEQGGALFLGPSETLGPLVHGFETLDKHWQLYRKQGESRMPMDARRQAMPHAEVRHPAAALSAITARQSVSQLLGVYDALLEEQMGPSLLLTERGELLHSFGGASRFLHVRDGRPGLEVQELLDGELKMILPTALRRCLEEPRAIVFGGVRVGGENEVYNVTVRALRPTGGRRPHVLVSFEAVAAAAREPRPRVEIDMGQVSREQLATLEAELGHAKRDLQSVIEQLETSNEELQAANEELQSSNEELQSTNEELQSVNEELYTVNAEYQRKIVELTEITNDMDNLLASTEVGTIFLDSELRIRKFTPQVAETFNLMAHDIGRPIETFAHKMAHPELVDDLRRVLATGQPIERDLMDDTGRSFFLRTLPYRAKGAADGVVLTLIDVSGLKAAEDALFHERYLLNSLLRNVPDAVYFKDARGRFIRVNPPMAERLGLSDPTDAVGKTALDLPRRELAMELHHEDEAVLRSGQAQHYRLERRAGSQGADAWDLVTRLPLEDRDGGTVGIVVIFRDVTEQRLAEMKIQEAVRRRDQFLAMLSHELRNPLGAMVTATSMIQSSANEQQLSFVGVLERQSRQMSRLLDDLLEASRVTQNKIELRKEVIDIRAVTEEAADVVRSQMEASGLEFSVDVEAEPVFVDGDSARLQQIQVNLLSNAAKYTARGGRVRLQLRRESGVAVIRVEDTGAGIPAAMLDSIFDMFVQSPRTLDRAGGGLGVGLTLVRALVEMHGGTVMARSEGEGKGSELVVRLPLAAPVAAEAPRLPEPVPLPRPVRILVVEDNLDSREMLCALLSRAGFECHAADNGAAALALANEVMPEVVILDVGLPEMDGFEVARRMRADPKHDGVRLMALTGYGQAADRAASAEAGFDDHVVKPVNSEELLRLLAGRHTRLRPEPVGRKLEAQRGLFDAPAS